MLPWTHRRNTMCFGPKYRQNKSIAKIIEKIENETITSDHYTQKHKKKKTNAEEEENKGRYYQLIETLCSYLKIWKDIVKSEKKKNKK